MKEGFLLMKEKFKTCNSTREKIFNTTVEIRKEVMTKIRDYGESLDREKYAKVERDMIRQEGKEIAKMIAEKDRYMNFLALLERDPNTETVKGVGKIYNTRADIVNILKNIQEAIVATQYDKVELRIVERELHEMGLLIRNKDRLIRSKAKDIMFENRARRKPNPYILKYFAEL